MTTTTTHKDKEESDSKPATAGNNEEPEPTQAESEMTEAIAKDRPTIDAAVKSFISLVCARSMSASGTDTGASAQDKLIMGIIPGLASASITNGDETTTTTTTQDNNNNNKSTTQTRVLQLARAILKAVNRHTFPIHDTVAYSMAEKPGTTPETKTKLLELSVVSRLWNALVQSEQKPSRFLGKRALVLAWKHLEFGKVEEEKKEWLDEFERLLFSDLKALPSDPNVDDDAALLWAVDGGAAELAKRRQRRMDAATDRGPSTPS